MPETNTPPPTSSGLSDFQLKLSYFYVTNKLLLRKLLIALIIAIDALLWFYVIFSVIVWAIGYQSTQSQITNLLYSSDSSLAAIESLKPQSLSFSDPESFGSDGERFDLLSEASNPNGTWLAEFDYTFKSEGSTSTVYHAFVLPGGKKALLDLGRTSSAVKLEISNLKWTRVLDFSQTKNLRDRFEITDDQYIAPASALEPSRMKFTVNNRSAYGYWDVGVSVMLYSAGNLTAVNYISVPQLKAESSREVELNWPKSLPAIDSWQIVPEVNYLDDKNIMPPPAY